MKPWLWTLISALALSGWTQAEDLSLHRYTGTVLRHHAGLRAAEARVLEAEAALKEVEYQRLPLLSARSSFTRGDHPVYVFGSLMEQGRFGPQNFAIHELNNPSDLTNIKSGLDLGVPLFTGLELTSASRQLELAAQRARAEQEGLAQQLRMKAAVAYLEVLLYREISQELDDRLAAARDQLGDAKRLKDRGVVLGSDYFAGLAIFNGLELWRRGIEGRQRAAQSRLNILAGTKVTLAQDRLRESLPALGPESAFFESALKQRADVRSLSLAAEQSEVGARQAGRTLWPKIEGFATLETNTRDFDKSPSNHLFGVAARLPFGDPSYFARRRKADSGRVMAQEGQRAAEEAALLEVAGAYHACQAAFEGLPAAREMASNAEESLRLFRPLYRSGRQSILDVLRAEEALAKAKAAYWQTLFDLHASRLQLSAASGTLDDNAVRDLSGSLEAKP